jgi:ABC-2 type transport system ATP-binding protein
MVEIEVRDLSKKFDDKLAVNHISFKVNKGEIFAFLGPNGAGKTTTLNMLIGLISPTSGEIYYKGELFSRDNIEIKKIIGVVPQYNNIDRDLTVFQNLKVHALLFGMKNNINDVILSAVDFAGLKEHMNKIGGKLSGGMKRRLVIARALLHKPDIIFLDEPSTGLDASARKNMWNFIRKIKFERNCTVFLTTHYIEEAEDLADRVLIIDNGRIVAEGSVGTLKQNTGKWALDIMINEKKITECFITRDEAIKRLNKLNTSASLRETSLEDVYLNITGKRINKI